MSHHMYEYIKQSAGTTLTMSDKVLSNKPLVTCQPIRHYILNNETQHSTVNNKPANLSSWAVVTPQTRSNGLSYKESPNLKQWAGTSQK